MNKALKIGFYLVVLVLMYLWFASVAKSCSSTTADSSQDEIENSSTVATDGDEFVDEFFEDGDSEENTTPTDEMGAGSSSSTINYDEVDDIIGEASSGKDYTDVSTTKSTTTTAPIAKKPAVPSGKYMVLAGSYLLKENADEMVSKLQKLGYNNAEIVVFNFSQYHTVCAGRFNSNSTANQLSSQLKRNGIDNYVHTKQ